jgi:hypothetical protein
MDKVLEHLELAWSEFGPAVALLGVTNLYANHCLPAGLKNRTVSGAAGMGWRLVGIGGQSYWGRGIIALGVVCN